MVIICILQMLLNLFKLELGGNKVWFRVFFFLYFSVTPLPHPCVCAHLWTTSTFQNYMKTSFVQILIGSWYWNASVHRIASIYMSGGGGGEVALPYVSGYRLLVNRLPFSTPSYYTPKDHFFLDSTSIIPIFHFCKEFYMKIANFRCILKRLFNPSSPERFFQTYFPKRGCCNPPPPADHQYWMSYKPKFATNVWPHHLFLLIPKLVPTINVRMLSLWHHNVSTPLNIEKLSYTKTDFYVKKS